MCQAHNRVCAAVLTLIGCASQPPREQRERDPQQCRDGADNDRDGLVDCADPDCWAFACEPAPEPDRGSFASAVSGAAGGSAAASAVVRDSGLAYESDARAAVVRDEDAGAAPPSAATCECSAGEACLDGVCKAPDIAGEYQLQIASARLPSATSTGVCYDTDSLFCMIGRCDSCAPDPYVVVWQNSVTRVGETSKRMDTTTPTWSDAVFSLSLHSDDDVLTFHVWDADAPGSTDIFSCNPDLRAQIRTGMLRCSPSARFGAAAASNEYEIVARIHAAGL